MEVDYNAKALDDINYWKRSGNKNVQKKITALIEKILNSILLPAWANPNL
jgi:toxin YoeB